MMVTNTRLQYLPPNGPREFTALVQSMFLLWLACVRNTFRDAFLANLLWQLPLLLWWWQTRLLFHPEPIAAWLEPDRLAPSRLFWGLFVVFNVISIGFAFAVLYRQSLISRGETGRKHSVWHAIARSPSLLIVSAGYLSLLAICALPIVIGALLFNGDPALTLIGVLVGLLISAAPLSWVSVAASFSFNLVLMDDVPALSAIYRSFRLVHGHWSMAALLSSLSCLAYLGILGTLTLAPFALTGLISVVAYGIESLLRPGWLIFGQLLSVPLLAALFPLCSAGYVVAYDELKLRSATC